MNKKGFTLVEVITALVLVSVVMTSMLASLVKLRDNYDVVHNNTDVILYSSTVSRIINNDLISNGGVKYVDCSLDGNTCDMILGNTQKRRIQIYTIQSGTRYTGEALVDKSTKVIRDTDNVFCETKPVSCTTTGSVISCICPHQKITTTLKYMDTTNVTSRLIYIKSLSIVKDAVYDKESNSLVKVHTTGHMFGGMYATNERFPNASKPNYINALSTINIEIYDGLDKNDGSYNIALSSASTFNENDVKTGDEIILTLVNDNFEIEKTVKITRGEFADFLYRLSNDNGTYTDNGAYNDISGNVYYPAIKWAISKNIMKGSGNTFNPNSNITLQDFYQIVDIFISKYDKGTSNVKRSEIARVLHRVSLDEGSYSDSVISHLPDVIKPSASASAIAKEEYEAIKWAVASQVMLGTSDSIDDHVATNFKPNRNIQLEHFKISIDRFKSKYPENIPDATGVREGYTKLVVKYGVGFYYYKKDENNDEEETLIKITKLDQNLLPVLEPASVASKHKFIGYYYIDDDNIPHQVIDQNGKILVPPTYFIKPLGEEIVAFYN